MEGVGALVLLAERSASDGNSSEGVRSRQKRTSVTRLLVGFCCLLTREQELVCRWERRARPDLGFGKVKRKEISECTL